METWKMIKEIMENPKKKFYDINEPEARNVYFDGKAIRWEENAEPLKLILLDVCDWEEVKEPVDFMEAVESGKYIRVEHEKITNDKKALFAEYDNLSTTLYLLTKHFSVGVLRDILLNGKWYIEE